MGGKNPVVRPVLASVGTQLRDHCTLYADLETAAQHALGLEAAEIADRGIELIGRLQLTVA